MCDPLPRHPRPFHGGLPLLAPALLLLLAGCAAKKGDVSGKVTFKNEPIPWGRITFTSQVGEKKVASSAIRNGNYSFKDFPSGAVRISVESFKAEKRSSVAIKPMAKGFTPPSNPELEPPPEAIGKHVVIPSKYGNAETSGLEYVVQPGTQTHDVLLAP